MESHPGCIEMHITALPKPTAKAKRHQFVHRRRVDRPALRPASGTEPEEHACVIAGIDSTKVELRCPVHPSHPYPGLKRALI
jgi:hypothetical protein